MPSASIKKKIPCSKENLIGMVLDIEKYPEFVPWCLKAKIYQKRKKGNLLEITADLTIGKSFFNETYKSYVIFDKVNNSIIVKNIDGPLKYLENKWFFKKIENNEEMSEIDFYVNFELKNKILNLLMTKSFDLGLKKIADAFEKRATELFNATK
jgi:coenzyme Q-binding protein COQ10